MRHDAEPAEYKQVTVLFADVVGSMDIAGAVGAERLREIMTEVFNRSAATVRRYGGTVDKFTGDGLMAVFGAPIALEANALRDMSSGPRHPGRGAPDGGGPPPPRRARPAAAHRAELR
jgi:class 3 adenylate cyclase